MDDALNLKDCIDDILSENTGTPRIKQVYIALIKHALIKYEGNRTKTAEYTGISTKTLRGHISTSKELRDLVDKYDKEKEILKEEKKEKETLIEETRTASKGLIRKIIKDIYKATYVYHLRGMFNLQRHLFIYPKVQNATFRKLNKFDREHCTLTRESAEDLREDIEIFIENGCVLEKSVKYDSHGNYILH